MKKVVIVVEGKSDLIFIRDLIIKNYTNYKLESDISKKEEKVKLNSENVELHIRVSKQNEKINSTGGWGELKNLSIELKEESFDKLLIIFDADNKKSDNIEHKQKLINEWCKEYSCETFFLPYNQKDDLEDLEDLVLTCITDQFKFFFHCWSGFMNCLEGNFKGEIIYPEKKRQLFAFKESFKKENSGIEESYLDAKYWNIDFKTNNTLLPIKEFFDKNIV